MSMSGEQSTFSETEAEPGQPLTLSDLLLRFVETNPDQLVGSETAEEWVVSMWRVRNPAAKLKKSLVEFLAIFETFDGPEVVALREVMEPLTK